MSETRTLRVLVIEDNIADVLLMREALKEFLEMPVEITNVVDGAEALAVLGSGHKFDVVILDLNLPGMDGHSFLERYKNSYPPIAVFTSSWNPRDEKRALALGAREFVRKPMTYEEYIQAVCHIVERWGNIPGEAHTAKNSN